MRRSWVRNLAAVVLGASILGWLATGLLFDGWSPRSPRSPDSPSP